MRIAIKAPILSLLLLSPALAAAGDHGKFSAGIIYPGAALRYDWTGKTSLELKAQAGSDILISGARLYRGLGDLSGLSLFCGAEADYIDFKGRVSKGSGLAAGAFIGGDIPISGRMFLSMDFGPMYIDLSDSATSETAGGVDYVINFGIYWKI